MAENQDPLPQVDMESLLYHTEKEKTELDKALELFLDPNNIEHNTELKQNEITAFSALYPLAEKYNLPVLDQFLRHNLIMRVSKNRGGRKEWVKIISRHISEQNQDMEDMPGWKKWLHKRR